MAMGENHVTKTGIMAEDGLLPLLALSGTDTDCVEQYLLLGRIEENGKFVRVLWSLAALLLWLHGKSDDLEIKRNCAYFLALLCGDGVP